MKKKIVLSLDFYAESQWNMKKTCLNSRYYEYVYILERLMLKVDHFEWFQKVIMQFVICFFTEKSHFKQSDFSKYKSGATYYGKYPNVVIILYHIFRRFSYCV